MPNQNIADLSTLEGSQINENQSRNVQSAMSIFNSQDDVTAFETACKEYSKVLDDAIKQTSNPNIT
jgi:hypothetical protein